MLPVLLAHGAKAAAQDEAGNGEGGRQALHYLAIIDPDPALLTLLLEAERQQRAFYECRIGSCLVHDGAGRSALHFAAKADAPASVVALLLKFGFDPDRGDHKGVTPLMRFAEHGTNPAVFLQVLERSEDPCRPSPQGLLVEAFLRKNESLMKCDPLGPTRCPLEAYKQRCP
jgi:ankyrin repeat protein